MTNSKKTKIPLLNRGWKAVLSLILAVTLAFGVWPTATGSELKVYAAESKVSDSGTINKYTESLGHNASTEYAGRIWTDKSVYDSASATFDLYGGGSATVENDSDFLVAYSALATSESISQDSVAPFDVVFVLDMSGSMQSNRMDNNKNRLQNAVAALNDSMKELLALNKYVRVGVIAFNTTSYEILPLDHYEQLNGKEFITSTTNTITVNAKGDKSTVQNKSWSTSSGTNMQKGFFEGMNMLAKESSTSITVNEKKIERIPVVVILSDGEPSKASLNTTETWWDISADNNTNANTEPKSIYGMKALMTATYMKQAIDRNYGTPEVNVYSIGVGISDISNASYKALAYASINPEATLTTSSNQMVKDIRDTWDKYAGNRTATLNSYTFKHPTSYDIVKTGDYSDLYYVDSYYDVNNKQMMDDTFSAIVNDILLSKAQVPTKIKGNDPLTSGYITYTDPIGEYMEVKDVKTILYAGQAFSRKSVSANTSTGTKTYVFEGEVHSAIYGNQYLANIMIQVTEDTDGNQTLTVKIPAAVIPVRVNQVELNSDGTVASNTNNNAYPIRVLYTVGLHEDVVTTNSDGERILNAKKISDEYLSANKNSDGTVNFYSNLYTGKNVVNGNTAGDTTVEFEPSHTNPFYYILEDTPIYTDPDLTNKAPASSPLVDGTTYYFVDVHYDGTMVVREAISRTGAQLNHTELVNVDGYWHRAEGSPRLDRVLLFEGTKTNNGTGTAEDFYAPTFVYGGANGNDAYEGKFVIYLGNNGVLSLDSFGALEISKTVEVSEGLNPKDEPFRFTVDFNGKDTVVKDSFEYTTVDSEGNVLTKGTIKDGGTLLLKNGEKATIENLPAGMTYSVTEAEAKGYTSEHDGDPTGTIKVGEVSKEAFVNTYEVEEVTYPTEGTLNGTKILTGRDWAVGTDVYTFFLRPVGEAPLPEGYNVDAGVTVTEATKQGTGWMASFKFGSIKFSKPGTYVYTIVEKEPENNQNLPGISYSGSLYRLVVTVEDNGDGTLKLSDDIQKLYTDDATPLFTYTNGNIVMNPGQEAQDEIVFINTYSVDDVILVPVALKAYTDNSGAKPLTPGMFEFKLEAVGVVVGENVQEDSANQVPMPVDSDGNRMTTVLTENEGTNITFPHVTFKHSDLSGANEIVFRYKMSEVLPDGATAENNYTVDGVTYDSRVYEIDVKVSVTEGSDVLNVIPIYPDKPNEDKSRIITFNNSYTPSPAKLSLVGEKTLNGRAMADDEFEFELTAANDLAKTVLLNKETVKNDASSSGVDAFVFSELTFKKPGTYVFNITETKGDAKGVTYDTHTTVVTVKVTDDNGQLKVKDGDITYNNGTISKSTDKAVFVNTYTTAPTVPISLQGSKVLTGKSLLEGEFYFEVKNLNTNESFLVTHGAGAATEESYSAVIEFLKDETYSEAGTYVYEIKEVIPDPQVGGTTYDRSVYKYEVVVKDNISKAQLEVESTALYISEDNGHSFKADASNWITFENIYQPEPYTYSVPVLTKVLNGTRSDELKEGEFTFQMSVVSANPSDGVILPAKATVTNTADGQISFGDITFTKAGTYVLKISEVKGNDENITYSDNELIGRFVVTDDRNGQLHLSTKSVTGDYTFTNNYSTSGTLDIEVTKNFSGREDNEWLDSDEFEYEIVVNNPATQSAIDAGDVVIDSYTTKITAADAVKKATFEDIQFNKAGTYHIIIREIDGGIDGVNYDGEARKLTITAVDQNDGTLDISYTIADDKTLTFVNIYDADSTELNGHANLHVEKTMEGREWLDSDIFTFTLAAFDETTQTAVTAGDVEFASTTLEVSTANKAHAHFGNITFHKTGTYTFVITEQEGTIPGVTNDADAERVVTVNVSDNGQGELVAKVVGDKSEALKFTNTYAAEQVVSAEIDVQKTLEGREWFESDTFEFVIVPTEDTQDAVDAGDVIMPEFTKIAITNDSVDHTESFGGITFNKAGTYTFVVRETKGSAYGVNYASNVENVTVEVTDNVETGELEANVIKSSDTLNFVNTYTPDAISASITGEKILTGGPALKSGAFIFVLSAKDGAPLPENIRVTNGVAEDPGKIDFGMITYTEAGTYVYEIREIKGVLAGMTYDSNNVTVTVTVSYDAYAGQLGIESVAYDNGIVSDAVDHAVFVNTYAGEPTELVGATELKVTKNFKGRPNNKWLSADAFEFTLEAVEDYGDKVILPAAELTVTSANKENAHFGNIKFTEAGTYQFKVTEKIPESATQQSDGSWMFNGIKYDADQERILTVIVKDNNKGSLVVSVDDANSDNLIFNNTYCPYEELVLEVTKVFDRDPLQAGDQWNTEDVFAFEITVSDAATKAAVKAGDIVLPENITIDSNRSDKKESFDSIRVNKEGIYKINIHEVDDQPIPGVIYNTQGARTVVITAEDQNDGSLKVSYTIEDGKTLTFVNTYDPNSAELSGHYNLRVTKNFTGREEDRWLHSDQFVFVLAAVEDYGDKVELPETILTVNAGNKEFAHFGNIIFHEAGTYQFTVTEQNNGISGVTYDENAKRTLTVKVTANGGQLEAVLAADESDSLTFTNTYDAKEVAKGDLTVTKVLEGREWLDSDVFTFTLKAVEDYGTKVTLGEASVTIKGTDSEKSAAFDAITFKESGTYGFVIEETEGEIPAVSYDRHKVYVEYVVSDDHAGQLVVASPIIRGSMTWTNTYIPEVTNASIQAVKIMKGRDLQATDHFTFTIAKETENAPMPMVTTVEAQADGKVDFGTLSFNKAGVYQYVITENAGDIAGVTYDTGKVYAKVTVTDDNAGHLSATVTYTKEGGNAIETAQNEFVNIYKASSAEPVSVFTAGKIVTASKGNSYIVTGGEFQFEIAPVEGNPSADPIAKTTVSNDSNGDIVFVQDVIYTEPGKYTYVVTEKVGSVPGISYDGTVYNIVVNVTDVIVEGQLIAEVTLFKDGEAVEDILFNNTYDPEAVSIAITGTKKLEGKELEADQFCFVLSPVEAVDGEGNSIEVPMPANAANGTATTTNSQDGKFTFNEITFTHPGVYTYKVTEMDLGADGTGETGYHYDLTEYTVVITVTDEMTVDTEDKEEESESETETKETEVEESIFESEAETEIQETEVETEIQETEAESDTEAETQETAAESESVETEALETTSEETAEEIQEEAPIALGVMIQEIHRTMTGMGQDTKNAGALKATITVQYTNANGAYVSNGTMSDIVFTNTYVPEPTSVNGPIIIEGTKTLTGRELVEGEFTFVLKDEENVVVREAKNKADGTFAFDTLVFTEAGTYYYTVTEVNDGKGGVTYDSVSYTVKIEVTDVDGYLIPTVAYADSQGVVVDEIAFSNIYEARGTEVQLGAAKVLDGRNLEAGEFTFVLKDVSGKEVARAINNADGKIVFDKMTYTEVGVYTYTVSEIAGNIAGMTYDQTVYTVTIAVTDNLNGDLEAEVNTGDKDIVFINNYEEPETETEPETSKPTPPTPPTADDVPTGDSTADDVPTGDPTPVKGMIAMMLISYATMAGVLVYCTERKRK